MWLWNVSVCVCVISCPLLWVLIWSSKIGLKCEAGAQRTLLKINWWFSIKVHCCVCWSFGCLHKHNQALHVVFGLLAVLKGLWFPLMVWNQAGHASARPCSKHKTEHSTELHNAPAEWQFRCVPQDQLYRHSTNINAHSFLAMPCSGAYAAKKKCSR